MNQQHGADQAPVGDSDDFVRFTNDNQSIEQIQEHARQVDGGNGRLEYVDGENMFQEQGRNFEASGIEQNEKM